MPKVSDEHRAARRQQIVSAAMRCVAREGFHKTTMAHVIAESGLSAGAVYGYFKGKTDLIKAIAEGSAGGLAGALVAIADGPGTVTVPGAVRSLVTKIDEIAGQDDANVARVALHAWAEAARSDEVREVVRDNVALLHAGWVRVLQRAEADGNLEPGGDHAVMARILVGLMPGFLVQGLLLGETDGPTYADGFADLLARMPREEPAVPS